MLDEDEFVETSDVEELAEELGRGEARPWHSSPRRSVSPLVSEEIYPRKKIKVSASSSPHTLAGVSSITHC